MIVDITKERFPEIYKIMLDSFPSCELRTQNGQRQIWDLSFYHIKAYEMEKEILAFIAYWDLPNCRFIEHLATTPECRGKGIGALLVEECIKGIQMPIFLEIEPIIESEPMTGRRAAFYKRLNFVVNDFYYEQLPLKDGDAIMPLWIMSYGEPIEAKLFELYKKQIYKIVYQRSEIV